MKINTKEQTFEKYITENSDMNLQHATTKQSSINILIIS
jgi:hypothetical protein